MRLEHVLALAATSQILATPQECAFWLLLSYIIPKLRSKFSQAKAFNHSTKEESVLKGRHRSLSLVHGTKRIESRLKSSKDSSDLRVATTERQRREA